jgi:small subunit ribosomal protein S9
MQAASIRTKRKNLPKSHYQTSDNMEIINATGRRKTAVARAYVSMGSGKIVINRRELTDYFPSEILQYIVNQPFALTGSEGKYDVKAHLDGGGITGQAEALRLAIARALCEIDKDANRPALKAHGLLTRDSREVERKKPGRPGARKRFQFSKR